MTKSWHQQFTRKPAALRTSPDGIQHHSVEEMNRWCKLLLDEKLGLIRNLKRQVAFPLVIDDQRAIRTPERKSKATGKMTGGRIMKYTADFTYERLQGNEWVAVIEDHKGFMDKVGELRIAVFEGIYGVKVYIHKR
jgi:hypothetical protein